MGFSPGRHDNAMVYILTNYNSTHEEDVARVEFLKSLYIQPYVMVYRKGTATIETKQLARYANNNFVFWRVPSFNDYRTNPKMSKQEETYLNEIKQLGDNQNENAE